MGNLNSINQNNRIVQSKIKLTSPIVEHIAIDDNLENGYLRVYASVNPIDIREVIGLRDDTRQVTLCCEILINEEIINKRKKLIIKKNYCSYGRTSFMTYAVKKAKEYAEFYNIEDVYIKE